MRFVTLFGLLLVATAAIAQTQKAPDVVEFVSVDAPVVVLNHVRVIDGTGAAAKEDQAVVIAGGKIMSIGPFGSAKIPTGGFQSGCCAIGPIHPLELDRSGYTVIPGIVGMHDHLYYTDSIAVQVAGGRIGEPGLFIAEIPYTAPRLYLAAGVTTMRTTGSLEPYTDLKVKSRIDANLMPGPSIDATAPYLEGAPTRFAQMHELTGRGRRETHGGLLGGGRHDLVQSVYEYYAGRAGSGDRGSARAQDETDRTSLFGNLAGGCSAGD